MNPIKARRIFFLIAAHCYLYNIALGQQVGQNKFVLKAKISGLTYKEVYLLKLYGDKQTLFDSASVNENGEFIFNVANEATRNSGQLYRVVLGQTAKAAFYNKPPQTFNIINDGSMTILTTNFENPVDSMVVKVGKENGLYYKYQLVKRQFDKKLDLLENLLRLYPDDGADPRTKGVKPDGFYKKIQKQYEQNQKELLNFTNTLIRKNPNAYFSKLLKIEQFPHLDASLSSEARLKVLKENYFRTSDFEDSLVLNSDVLTNKVITFLGLYRNAQYTEEQQTKEFIKATNLVLPVAKAGNPIVYQYILNYMLEGFNQIKQDALLSYITDNYLQENSCKADDERINALLKKSADYKRTAMGATAPEILFVDSGLRTQDLVPLSGLISASGNRPIILNQPSTLKKLSDIQSGYTLVVFWASWCPHCTKMLPELKKAYDDNKSKGLEVVAISLDTDTLQWITTLAQGNYNWYNYSDFKKWNSPPARAYNVNGTPTMFLLDKDKKIIAKPENVLQLVNFLSGR